MDEHTTLERRIRIVFERMGGPDPSFDALAIARTAAGRSTHGRPRVSIGTARALLTGSMVMLAGAMVLLVVGLRPDAAIAPPAVTPTSATAEVRGSFSRLDGVPGGAGWESAIALADGRALVIRPDAASPWDPATREFGPMFWLPDARWNGTVVGLRDGRVMVAGGITGMNVDGPTDSVVIWDPTTVSWSPTGSMRQGRAQAVGIALPDGRVLVAGGSTGHLRGPDEPLLPVKSSAGPVRYEGAEMWDTPSGRMAEIWDPSTGAFRAAGETAMTYIDHPSLSLLPDGRVLIFGQTEEGAPSAEAWDPVAETWTTIPAPPETWAAATPLGDGRVLLIGTDAALGIAGRAVLVWDPRSGDAESTGSLIEGRLGPSATVLLDGRVLVAGGAGPDVRVAGAQWESGPATGSAEIWDPRTGTFFATGPLEDPRSAHAAVRLTGGEVLVVGGYDQASDPVSSVEVFQEEEAPK